MKQKTKKEPAVALTVDSNNQPHVIVERKKSKLTEVKRHWQLYVFMILPLALIFTFAYIPMPGIQLAFKDYDFTLGIWGSPWVGFEHFETFFKGPYFANTLTNTITISIYGLFAGFPISVMFALLLNSMRSARYRKIIQTTTYIPHFISTVVMCGMVLQLLNPRIGLIHQLGELFGVAKVVDLMALPAAFAHVYVWSGIWQGLGWGTIIYLSALSAADAELHEAMEIDGATRFQRVINLDLPCILPTVSINLILSAGNIMSVGFEKVFLLQNTLNASASEVISTYVYKIGLGSNIPNYGLSSAVGLFNSVINLIILVTVNQIAKRVEGGATLW